MTASSVNNLETSSFFSISFRIVCTSGTIPISNRDWPITNSSPSGGVILDVGAVASSSRLVSSSTLKFLTLENISQ